jgi:hypothetical protein
MSTDEYQAFIQARSAIQGTSDRRTKNVTLNNTSSTNDNNTSSEISALSQEFTSRLNELSGSGGHAANPNRSVNYGRRIIRDTTMTERHSANITSTLQPNETIMILDSGTDSTVVGRNCDILEISSNRTARLTGFKDDLHADDLPIVTAAFACDLTGGPTIIIEVNEAVYIKNNTTSLLSTTQAREFGVAIDDVPIRYGGTQQITVDDYKIPLALESALLHIRLRKPTVHELETCDRVVLTSDEIWDPSDINGDDASRIVSPYNANAVTSEYTVPARLAATMTSLRQVATGRTREAAELVPATYRSKLGWLPLDTIQLTFEATTQMAKHVPLRIPLRRHFKSRFPYLNRTRLSEIVATDTFFSHTKAYGGYTCAQLFIGLDSHFVQVYGLQRESQGVQALEDFIRDIGAPHDIRSDNAKMETGVEWSKICRKYNIAQQTTEPEHPHQNPAERGIQDVKKFTTIIMDRTNTPSELWFLCTLYVVYLRNRTAMVKLG